MFESLYDAAPWLRLAGTCRVRNPLLKYRGWKVSAGVVKLTDVKSVVIECYNRYHKMSKDAMKLENLSTHLQLYSSLHLFYVCWHVYDMVMSP